MEGLRVMVASDQSPLAPCNRCQSIGCPWDRIGPQPVCPDCQEALALGEADPLVERLVPNECAVCGSPGTVPYLTYPLHARDPLAIDLCPNHFHALLARRLDRPAYRVLSRQLQEFGLSSKHIFLLHEAFYDERGQPLQPVRDV